MTLRVSDDGHGFDPDAVVPAEDGESGIGLVGMRERLRLLGGRLEIESAPGEGARFRVLLPALEPRTATRARQQSTPGADAVARVALTGRTTSPGIFDVLVLLGRDESLARIADQMTGKGS